MARLELPALYAILDPEQTAGRSLDTTLAEILAGGARWLQLRVKSLAPAAFFELALRVRSRTAA